MKIFILSQKSSVSSLFRLEKFQKNTRCDMKIESIGSIGSSNSKYDSLEFGYQLNTNNVKAKSTVYKKDTDQSRVTALQTFIYYWQHTNEWN